MKYTCHSGGCPGADMCWENEGNKYGVHTIAYSFGGHTQEGKNRIILTHEQLMEGYEHVKIASVGLKRSPEIKWPYVKHLLCRNWYQVKNAETIFAIGKFIDDKRVSGGTGWAVQMGIDNKKTVFFFDQENVCWNIYNYEEKKFEKIGYIPKLTENFAGVGTREINENGIKAIQEILKYNLEIKCHRCNRILNGFCYTTEPGYPTCCECMGWGESPPTNSPTSSYGK
jgi:hypothetical protein